MCALPIDFGEGVERPRPTRPTLHPPGTWAKVLAMAARYERREQLFLPQDAGPDDSICVIYEDAGNGVTFPAALGRVHADGTVERVEEGRPRHQKRPQYPSDVRARTDALFKAQEAARKRRARRRKRKAT